MDMNCLLHPHGVCSYSQEFLSNGCLFVHLSVCPSDDCCYDVMLRYISRIDIERLLKYIHTNKGSSIIRMLFASTLFFLCEPPPIHLLHFPPKFIFITLAYH